MKVTSENFFQSHYIIALFYSMFKTEESNHADKVIYSKSFPSVFRTTSLHAETDFV